MCVSSSVVCLIAVKFTDVLININLSQKQTDTEVQRLSLQGSLMKWLNGAATSWLKLPGRWVGPRFSDE